MDIEKFFTTDNILLASFLLTMNAHLVEIVEETAHRFLFKFSPFDKCNELKQQYLNNANAPARELFSHREMLISEMKNRNQYKNG